MQIRKPRLHSLTKLVYYYYFLLLLSSCAPVHKSSRYSNKRDCTNRSTIRHKQTDRPGHALDVEMPESDVDALVVQPVEQIVTLGASRYYYYYYYYYYHHY